MRATPTGVKNVHEMYCNKANGSMFAPNVGDLLDELGQGHYIIVPAKSNPSLTQEVPAESKALACGSIESLLHRASSLEAQLQSKIV